MSPSRVLASTAIVLGGLVLVAPSGAADASCTKTTRTRIVEGRILTETVRFCEAPASASAAPNEIPLAVRFGAACLASARIVDADPVEFCRSEADPSEELPLELIARAFRETSIPAAQLQIEPPNGRTLVNFDTNFFTTRGPLTRTVTVLGQAVTLAITPANYTWHFGDGSTLTTTEPGRPYPDLDVTHAYRRVADVRPRVDTTYTATYRVGGGPALPVPGTVTIAGTAVDLTVLEARPVLVPSG